MSHALSLFLITFGLFLGMLLFLEIGRRVGVRRMEEDAGAAGKGSAQSMVPFSPCWDCCSLSCFRERAPDSTRAGN